MNGLLVPGGVRGGTFSPLAAITRGAWAMLLSWRSVLPTRARAGRCVGGFAHRGRPRAGGGWRAASGGGGGAWDVAASQPPSHPTRAWPTGAWGTTASQPPSQPTHRPPLPCQQWSPEWGQHLCAPITANSAAGRRQSSSATPDQGNPAACGRCLTTATRRATSRTPRHTERAVRHPTFILNSRVSVAAPNHGHAADHADPGASLPDAPGPVDPRTVTRIKGLHLIG